MYKCVFWGDRRPQLRWEVISQLIQSPCYAATQNIVSVGGKRPNRTTAQGFKKNRHGSKVGASMKELLHSCCNFRASVTFALRAPPIFPKFKGKEIRRAEGTLRLIRGLLLALESTLVLGGFRPDPALRARWVDFRGAIPFFARNFARLLWGIGEKRGVGKNRN